MGPYSIFDDGPEDQNRPTGKLPDIPPIIDVSTIIDQDLFLNDKLPGLKVDEPTALLLDINNLFGGTRENGFRIDYARLANVFSSRCDLRYKAAFTAVKDDREEMLAWMRFMESQGYILVTKQIRGYTDQKGKYVEKGTNLDVEMAVEAMGLSPEFGHVIIGSCDGDFVGLVNKLRQGGFRKISVLGVKGPRVSTMSSDLVDVCDNFYNLYEFKDMICQTRRREGL